MRTAAWILLVFLLLPHSSAPQDRIAVCDLLRNSDKFNGKVVTVRGTWRYGYEWSQLYCLDCLDKGRVWLESSDEMDDASAKLLKHIPKGSRIVNLTVQGIFMTGSSYGHMNGYRHQLLMRKVSDLVVLQKGMKSVEEEKKTEKKWACGGTNPK